MDSKPLDEAKTAAAPKRSGGAKYTGDGSAYIGGVPARNLTAEEWAALSAEQRDACLATGLYKEN